MDHHYIRDHQIVDQYLRNQLPEAVAAEFEEHYFDCAECMDELEVAKSFGEGLSDARHAERPTGAGVGNGWRIAFAVTAAALVIVMAEAYFLHQRAVSLEAGLSARQTADRNRVAPEGQVAAASRPQTPVVVYRMSMERSAGGAVRRIVLPASPSELVFALEFAAGPQVPGYRAELRGGDGSLLWESGQLQPDAQGATAITVPSTMFRPGDYSIRIDGITPEGRRLPVAEFSFRADAHH